MATNAGVRNILPEIPITLAVMMGDITIRFGELEREVATAMARVQCRDEGADQTRFLTLIGEHKQAKSLGALIDKAQKIFNGRNFDWIDFDALKKLKDQRNAVHDSLVEDFDGTLTWQASGTRKHRPIDYAELLVLRECVVRTIVQIHNGSRKYKELNESSVGDSIP